MAATEPTSPASMDPAPAKPIEVAPSPTGELDVPAAALDAEGRPWSEHEVVIDQSRARLSVAIREAIEGRELLYLMTRRDISVRYRQALLGMIWAIIIPLVKLTVFSIFFGFLGRLGPADIPYVVFLFSGMVIWDYYNSALGRAANSLEASRGLLGKVYFPRLLLPVSGVLSPLVELGFMLAVLACVMGWYSDVIAPNWTMMLWLPVWALLAFGGALGFGLWLAGFNAHYRDVRQALPVFIQMWYFSTPVLYPMEMVREKFPTWAVHLYELNPMVAVVMGFRAGLLGMEPPTMSATISCVVVVVGMLASGLFVFNRMEKTIADVL